ncbi:AMP-binding protein [Alteromonas sp. C1M14]|uniref:AMP-binding protein n=1 Tax=Alteromonas sp. C1M14 TaxID=2841567 RepID=UPI001C092683|nr:AMP-binding protein [Alteromonas sp. C1M14]MBU2979658.1 AMP-binding protein [Alteromonas sp. C1M14]
MANLLLPLTGALFYKNNQFVDAQTWQQDITAFRQKVQTMALANQTVLLFCEDTYEFAVRLFALGMESIDIILPPNNQPQTHAELAKLASAYCGDKIIDTPLSRIDEYAGENALPHNDTLFWPHTGKLIFFTSGSTGKAKPIVKHWWQVNTEVACLINSFFPTPSPSNTGVLSTVSHQHVYGLLFKLLLPLASSMTIYPQYLYPEDMAATLTRIENAIVIASPAFLVRLVQDNLLIRYKAQLNKVFSSGAPLPDKAATTLYQQLSLPATQVYGSTETGGIAWREITGTDTGWRPFAGIEVASGDDATLRIRSPYLVDDWTTLADRVKITENGTFTLLGRTDRIAKVEDKRLDMEDMERHLQHHRAVHRCRLLQLAGEKRSLAIVVELKPDYLPQSAASKRALVTQLKQFLTERFEPVCFPRKWRFVTELPFNSQGKLSYSSLEALFV